MKLHPNQEWTVKEWVAMVIAWPLAFIIGGILILIMKGNRYAKQ
jgi:hypothetical protein